MHKKKFKNEGRGTVLSSALLSDPSQFTSLFNIKGGPLPPHQNHPATVWCSIPAPMPKRYISYTTSSLTGCTLEQDTRGGIPGRSTEESGRIHNTPTSQNQQQGRVTPTASRKYGRW
jgi:hypothetical protein